MKALLATLILLTALAVAYSSIKPAAPAVCPFCKCGFMMQKCELESCVISGAKEPECCQTMCHAKNDKKR